MSAKSVRYPSYPLVVHDPYFSIWSPTDLLTDSWSQHWTGHGQTLAGLIRIDGESFCFMSAMRGTRKMTQKSVQVLPTRTIYMFEDAGIRFTLTFLTPALPHKLNVLARPITYICFDTEAIDGKKHDVSVYFDADCVLAVNEWSDKIVWSRYKHQDLDLLSASSANQDILGKSGDNLRIDWGYAYLGAPLEFKAKTTLESNQITRKMFYETGKLPENDNLNMPQPARSEWLCMAASLSLNAEPGKTNSAYLLLAYNDVMSIEYLYRKIPGYWTMETSSFSELLSIAVKEFAALKKECADFDAELMADAETVGGKNYAELCAGAFRQAIGAHKLAVDFDGVPLFFSKENFSNGCIATVDVTYPSAPLFLLCQPELVKGMMIPILEYASTRRWKFPFAPHDLGTYPLANRQVYGGGEQTEDNQMPVEECGNMLILAAAIAKFHNDKAFILKYWAKLTQWADYLLEKGYDPENQLCTDDFAGHLAHNTNLSIKAIVALGGFALMAEMAGEPETAKKFSETAKKYAEKWAKDADNGEFYRLAFDREGSWSQKYNLVWDRLLDLNLFPACVAEKELAHYKKMQNRYGLPLDSRKTYTKIDWILWSATLTGKDEDFKALLDPVHLWMTETSSRVPMTDWYETEGKPEQIGWCNGKDNGKQVGFQARSVVGGLFIKLLADEKLREKWGRFARK